MRFVLGFLIIGILSSCNTGKRLPGNATMTFQDQIHEILDRDSTFQYAHTGLVVQDLSSSKSIIDYKGHHYYTPASNTKLLTFYTALSVLGDSIVGLKVYENEDSMIIWGTGDPSFLYHKLTDHDHISEMLKSSQKELFISFSNYQDEHYGEGWSWDDYKYSYQADKSAFPIYGNVVSFQKESGEDLEIIPSRFETLLQSDANVTSNYYTRDERQNVYRYHPELVQEIDDLELRRAFLAEDTLVTSLLSDYLGKKVNIIDTHHHLEKARPVKSVHLDSLYTLLLQPSDNFVAEQLLLNCGMTLFDTMQTQKVISWASDNLLQGMPDPYQWVDGSGLSRYNMTTPHNMVWLLRQIYRKVEKKRLFELLPTGGETGTIARWYASEVPFIHAKTGTLRNNHSLSGFLVGDSGKIYAFSFMNSNYLVTNSELKTGMDRILRILKHNL